jgi:hypothetical protein
MGPVSRLAADVFIDEWETWADALPPEEQESSDSDDETDDGEQTEDGADPE